MRKHLLAAGIAAAVLIPSLALAQETCEQRSANRTAGTVLGAVGGALLGSAVAGHGEKGAGAAIGGVTGAVIGNQVSRGPRDCAHAYGYYDNGGGWHDNHVDRTAAYGYYDRSGVWVDGSRRASSGYHCATHAYQSHVNTAGRGPADQPDPGPHRPWPFGRQPVAPRRQRRGTDAERHPPRGPRPARRRPPERPRRHLKLLQARLDLPRHRNLPDRNG